MNYTGTITQMLAEFILHSAGARLVRIEPATKDHPTLVYFVSGFHGDAPACCLPVTELCHHAVHSELRKSQIEPVAVGRVNDGQHL